MFPFLKCIPDANKGLLAVSKLNSINFKLHLIPSGNSNPSLGFPQSPLGVTFHMITFDYGFIPLFEIFQVIDHLIAQSTVLVLFLVDLNINFSPLSVSTASLSQ